MRSILILAAIFFASCSGKKCDCEEVLKLANPDISKPPERIRDTAPGKNLMVSIAGDNKVFVGTRELPLAELDSMLGLEIDRVRGNDSLTVVINADTASDYGIVFKIMRSAKKKNAKVVARISDYP